jgi:CheY-like chemotaxis protein
MAMFGMKKTKPSEGSELVLAYLEDAQRVRAVLLLVDHRGREVPATFVSVMEDKVVVAPQGALTVDKGGEVSLLFIQEGLRFKAPTRLLEAKPGSATLEVPSSIALAERRKKPRARLNPREGATVTVLTGLFDGVGMNGTIENISESGICVRVDRAMDVKTQRKMHMGANMLPVGQPLMLIKMAKLPKCPTLELGGTVAWLDASQGVLLGIAFEPGKEGMLGSVRSLVAGRAGAIPTSVPPKARRQSEAAREEEQGKYTPKPAAKKEPEPAPKVEPAAAEVAPAPAEPPPPPAPATSPEPAPAPEAPPPDDRSQALLRVKKRARGLLLAMPAGSERDALAAFLSGDGYGRVLCADTLTELLEHVGRPGIHLILVDGGVAELQSLALASFLRSSLDDAMPKVVLAEGSVDADLVLGAQEVGVAQILVKPYDLDLEFRRMLEGHLGIG